MTKFRVAFDVDLSKISPEDFGNAGAELEAAEALITSVLLETTRKAALKQLVALRMQAGLSDAQRSTAMAEQLRAAKLTLQAEANLTVEALPDDAVVLDDTPERIALAA